MAKKQRLLVCIYVRKSRLKNDESLEIERQIELLIEFCEKNNMDYVVFSEEGQSENWDRPELQKMLKELERGIYDGVLVTDQDRLTRDRTDFGLFVRFAKKQGLLFFTLNKTYNFINDDDMFVSGIQSEMDNHFMRITKRKLKRGRIQALLRGIYFGVAPYGFKKDSSKHLIPHPDESKVVQDIYNMYVNEGFNQAEIVEQLTMRGKLTRNNKPFTIRTISIILSNVANIGRLEYQLEGEELISVENAHPALVNTDTFNKAQIIRNERRVVPQSFQRGVYSLSKLLVCPNCHQTLSFCMKYNKRSARNTLDKSQRELYVLNCHASKSQKSKAKDKGKSRCKNNGIRVSRIEEDILEKLKLRLLDIDNEIEQILSGNTSYLSKVATKQQELTQQFNKLNEQRKNVQDGFKMGIYNATEAKVEIDSINEMQLSIEQELKNLEGRDVKAEVDRKKQMKDKIELILSHKELSPNRMNKLLHSVIDRVYYWKEESDVGGEKPFVLVIEYKE